MKNAVLAYKLGTHKLGAVALNPVMLAGLVLVIVGWQGVL